MHLQLILLATAAAAWPRRAPGPEAPAVYAARYQHYLQPPQREHTTSIHGGGGEVFNAQEKRNVAVQTKHDAGKVEHVAKSEEERVYVKRRIDNVNYNTFGSKATIIVYHNDSRREQTNGTNPEKNTIDNNDHKISSWQSIFGEADRWIWTDGGAPATAPATTEATSTSVDLEDRAAFTGDDCATPKVKVNGICQETD